MNKMIKAKTKHKRTNNFRFSTIHAFYGIAIYRKNIGLKHKLQIPFAKSLEAFSISHWRRRRLSTAVDDEPMLVVDGGRSRSTGEGVGENATEI